MVSLLRWKKFARISLTLTCALALEARADVEFQLRPQHAWQLCGHINGSSQDAGAKFVLWECENRNSQSWTMVRYDGYANNVFSIRSVNSGQCLDVYSEATHSGAELVQWHCNGKENQQFTVTHLGNGWHSLVAVHSGLCLDVNHSGTQNGTKIQQWLCNGSEAQQWYPLSSN